MQKFLNDEIVPQSYPAGVPRRLFSHALGVHPRRPLTQSAGGTSDRRPDKLSATAANQPDLAARASITQCGRIAEIGPIAELLPRCYTELYMVTAIG